MTPKTLSSTVRGFTLVESLAAMAVSATLAAVGVPQLSGLMGAKASDASIQSLATTLRLVRSEALKRGEEVTICARDPKAGDLSPACAPTGKDWSAGWIAFVDRAQRGRLDEGDVLVQVYQPGKSSLRVQATLRYITIQPTGISLTAASHFDFLPQGNAEALGARRVCISKPGRLRKLDRVMDCTT